MVCCYTFSDISFIHCKRHTNITATTIKNRFPINFHVKIFLPWKLKCQAMTAAQSNMLHVVLGCVNFKLFMATKPLTNSGEQSLFQFVFVNKQSTGA